MKKALSVSLALALALSLFTACGGTSAAPSGGTPASAPPPSESASSAAGSESPASPAGGGDREGLVVVSVPKKYGSSWFDSCDWEGKRWAEENGAKHHYVAPSAVDATEQMQCLYDALALSPDIITCIPVSVEVVDEFCLQAKEQGSTVLTHEGGTLKNIDYNVDAFSPADFGALFAKKTAEIAGEDCQYCLTVGSLTLASHNQWAQAYYEYATKTYPNMKCYNNVDGENVVSVETNNNSDDAYRITKELIQANPGLNVIVTFNAASAQGISRAITELDKIGEVYCLAVITPSTNREYVENGSIAFGSFWYPGYAQYAMYEAGARIIEGKPIRSGDNLGVEGYEDIVVDGKNIYGHAWFEVTKENIDEMCKIL